MPGGDGTGPMGMGPMTGRAAGYCAGYGVPGYMNPYVGGRGFGYGFYCCRRFGRGFGRGFRGRWFYGDPYLGYPVAPSVANPAADPYAVWQTTPKQEMEMLQSQAEMLNEQLTGIRKRIEELEKEVGKEKN